MHNECRWRGLLLLWVYLYYSNLFRHNYGIKAKRVLRPVLKDNMGGRIERGLYPAVNPDVG